MVLRKKQLYYRLLLEKERTRSRGKVCEKDGKMPGLRESRSWQGVSSAALQLCFFSRSWTEIFFYHNIHMTT